LQRLASQDRQLEVIPGATHLFEEAGALEKVAQLATDWFARIFTAQGSRQEPSVS
jgi:putative phosphoribosyl transferase